jgi:hypothetical protein
MISAPQLVKFGASHQGNRVGIYFRVADNHCFPFGAMTRDNSPYLHELAPEVLKQDLLLATYLVICTKRRVVSVSATSVGSRSIELAP